ncbi:hypothetical protein [Alteribacillus sp. HJP-4]|uniref:hypothetical protein n=1 Tax=Alteribacillus sp. HJP-4 TaxID=2775394 RepID=UPI0035CD0E25
MFNGNKLVVILPTLLMILLFAGGGFYITQAEIVTNDELDEHVKWDTSFEENQKSAILDASWSWEVSPEDGFAGNDYIGVTILDDNGEIINSDSIQHYDIQIGENESVEAEAETVENGVLFTFPNTMLENKTVGNEGSIAVEINGEAEPERAIISYLHTWEEHNGLDSKDARFFERDFSGKGNDDESFFWVMERFVNVEGQNRGAG